MKILLPMERVYQCTALAARTHTYVRTWLGLWLGGKRPGLVRSVTRWDVSFRDLHGMNEEVGHNFLRRQDHNVLEPPSPSHDSWKRPATCRPQSSILTCCRNWRCRWEIFRTVLKLKRCLCVGALILTRKQNRESAQKAPTKTTVGRHIERHDRHVVSRRNRLRMRKLKRTARWLLMPSSDRLFFKFGAFGLDSTKTERPQEQQLGQICCFR